MCVVTASGHMRYLVNLTTMVDPKTKQCLSSALHNCRVIKPLSEVLVSGITHSRQLGSGVSRYRQKEYWSSGLRSMQNSRLFMSNPGRKRSTCPLLRAFTAKIPFFAMCFKDAVFPDGFIVHVTSSVDGRDKKVQCGYDYNMHLHNMHTGECVRRCLVIEHRIITSNVLDVKILYCIILCIVLL